ncbi:ABC transporter ATP-binding protein [Paraburkholderia sp.]|uniref:ABC transporter ATP-binding protein n=1 Tax=Paraburkholderia sp. TaxID=1926495 RepID=UPI0039E4AC5E
MGAEISLRSLCRSYGNTQAIDNVSLDIGCGELVTLLGPSGSGKTAILSTIAGFAEPTAGEILINGVAINRLPPEARNLGVVFQHYALFPHLRVAQNIAYPLVMRGIARENIERQVKVIAHTVGLGDYLERYPAQLSGGQQQRVALARAMVFNPSALLLDEPLSALDKHLREKMQIELKQLHDNTQMTMLFVTHDQEEALLISDRVAIMNAGRLEQVDTPENVYLRPASRFVAEFMGESNFIVAKAEKDGVDGTAFRTAGDLCIESSLPRPVRHGQSVTLMVRPERVMLGEQAAALPNCFSGRVRERLFSGDTLRLKVELGADLVMTAKLANSRFCPQPMSLDEAIPIGWHDEDMVIFDSVH